MERKGGVPVLGRYESLVRKYERQAYNLVYRMVGNQPDAVKVLQFALADAYTKFDPAKADELWLMRQVVRVCLNHLSAAKAVFHEPPAVQQALGGMAAEDRLLVVLHDLLGYKYDQIGWLLGMEHEAVVRRISRARKSLRGAVAARTA